MGSSGFDSPFSSNPFSNNIFEPSINPKDEFGCNMIETFTKVGEVLEDYQKEQREGKDCLICKHHFYPKSNGELYCYDCRKDETENYNNHYSNFSISMDMIMVDQQVIVLVAIF